MPDVKRLKEVVIGPELVSRPEISTARPSLRRMAKAVQRPSARIAHVGCDADRIVVRHELRHDREPFSDCNLAGADADHHGKFPTSRCPLARQRRPNPPDVRSVLGNGEEIRICQRRFDYVWGGAIARVRRAR